MPAHPDSQAERGSNGSPSWTETFSSEVVCNSFSGQASSEQELPHSKCEILAKKHSLGIVCALLTEAAFQGIGPF